MIIWQKIFIGINPSLFFKATAQKEKEKVSSLFAEATKVLATFKKEVLSFIEVDERAMLGRAREELQHKEERRALLMEHKRNLEKVSSMDTITFLQVCSKNYCCRWISCQQRDRIGFIISSPPGQDYEHPGSSSSP